MHAPPTQRVVGVELAFGLVTRFVGIRDDDGLRAITGDTRPLALVAPHVEWPVWHFLHLGLDAIFASVDDPVVELDRRGIFAPGVRARLGYDVWGDLRAEAMFGGGFAFWSGGGSPQLVGLSRRWALGAAWKANETVAPFLWLGNHIIDSGPLGKGPLSTEYDTVQPVAAGAFMLTVGVRTVP